MTKTAPQSRAAVSLEPESLAETFIAYQKPILIGAIVVAAGGIGTWLWVRSAQIREERAGAAYQVAETAFVSGNRAGAQTELERLVTRFPGTNAGAQSALLLAQVMYEQSKFAEGIVQLESALRRAPTDLKPSLLGMIAAGHEGSGKPLDAAAAYARAATAARFEADADRFRMEEARTRAAGGDREGALSLYRQISDREDSPYGGEARLRMGEVAAAP